jgi:hypothetical protein
MSESLAMWEGRKVMVLLPCYKSMNPNTHLSLFANYAKYGPDKMGVDIQDLTLVHLARNVLTHRAYNNTKAETFVFCDDDMILPVGNENFFNGVHKAGVPAHMANRVAFSRIMSHGQDKGIVGALYFGRHSAGRAQCASGFYNEIENKNFHKFKYDGLVPQKWVAPGFMKVERWVFENMKSAIDGGRWPNCKPLIPGSKGYGAAYGYFEHLQTAVGEDASFGVRAGEIGVQSYVDAGLVCLHTGGMEFGPSNTTS